MPENLARDSRPGVAAWAVANKLIEHVDGIFALDEACVGSFEVYTDTILYKHVQ